MSLLVFLVFVLAMTGHSDASWCVCRSDVSDSALQKTLDYACGAGADCSQILQNGPCFNPNTVRAHCSYAVNSYFQKKGQAQGSCEFANTATVSSTDPSPGGSCVFPSTASSTGGTSSTTTPPGSSTTPTTPGSTTSPSTTTPGSTTPGSITGGTSTGTGLTPTTPTGVMGGGGLGTGLGPTGSGINTDSSDAESSQNIFSLMLALWFSGLVFWWS